MLREFVARADRKAAGEACNAPRKSVAVPPAIGAAEHVVLLADAEAERGGRHLSYRTAKICHVTDGKVTARWAFSDDTQAIIDLFA